MIYADTEQGLQVGKSSSVLAVVLRVAMFYRQQPAACKCNMQVQGPDEGPDLDRVAAVWRPGCYSGRAHHPVA